MAKPPTPQRVVDPSGQTLYTAADIHKGQQVFLHNGLMEYGSVFGHGAYLGPDYTADYLRRASNFVIGRNGGAGSDSAARRTIAEFRTQRYVKRTGTLTLTASQAEAYRRLVGHYSRFFSDPTTEHGLRPNAITDRTELRQLTAFFGWTAWAASNQRARGHNTTNQPHVSQVCGHDHRAAHAAHLQQADRQRDRLERALADRSARRDRDPVRRL